MQLVPFEYGEVLAQELWDNFFGLSSEGRPKLKKKMLPLQKNPYAFGFTNVLREFNEELKVHILVENHQLFLDS